MLPALLVVTFLALQFLYSMRLHQTAGERDRIAWILTGLAALVAVAAIAFVSGIAGALMLVGWFALPFVTGPIAARVADSFATGGPRVASPAQKERMKRLRDGELSLQEYFEEGHADTREDHKRLKVLAARRDIFALLNRKSVSFDGYISLSEQLHEIPERQWEILGSPTELEELIRLVARGKGPVEIGNTFRRKPKPAA